MAADPADEQSEIDAGRDRLPLADADRREADVVGVLQGGDGPAAVEAVVGKLQKIPALATKLAEAKAAGWRKWPSVYLPDIVKDPAYEQAVLDATAAAVAATQSPTGASDATP